MMEVTARGGRQSKLLLAFAAIYLIWGSTYLAIRYAVETLPPMFMMGTRHSIAGGILYFWARLRGAEVPTGRHGKEAVIAGGLLFLFGHGSLAWAQQHVASGLAALLIATEPLWVVVLDWVDPTGCGPLSVRPLDWYSALLEWDCSWLGRLWVSAVLSPRWLS